MAQATTNGCVFPGPYVPNTLGTGCWSEGDAFSGVQSDAYWSSATDAGNPTFAWYAFTGGGGAAGTLIKTSFRWVWPVRVGP